MAYIAALISAIVMTSVYLTDKVMAGSTYTRASQPMFVSSAFCVLPGILLYLVQWDNPPPTDACSMAFGAGCILALANWLYFTVIYSEAGESSEVASFECASVLMIVLAMFVLKHFVPLHESIKTHQWIGVLIGAIGLIAIHVFGDKMEFVDAKHRLMLFGFMFFGATFEMAIDRAMFLATIPLSTEANPRQIAYLQISPYFWFGLFTGCMAMLPQAERQAWSENWPNLKRHWRLIAFVELLAIIAFAAVVLGFAEGHVAVIALLAGTFPVMVLIGGVLLRRYCGFNEETFPLIRHPWKKAAAVILVITGAILASL